MIIRNHASSSARLFKTCGQSLTDHSQRSKAHLIEPQTFFSMVSGDKADNQIFLFLNLLIDSHE